MTQLESPSKPLFLNYIHYLRGLAILLIVGIHCRISFPWEDKIQARIFESLLDNSTIIFIFISGFLFQHLFVQRFNFKKYLQKKAKFVVLPYLLISILPILDKLYLEDHLVWLPLFLEDKPAIYKVLYMLVSGKHFGPFWFIPMIILFYLIGPLLVKMDNPKFYKYCFPLIFIAGLFTYEFGYYSSIIDSFIFFFPIYLFGMFASHYKEEIIKHGSIITIIVLLLYCTITLLEVFGVLEIHKLVGFEIKDPHPYFIFNLSKLKISALCLALINVFYWIRHKPMPFFKILGEYSFGIYFIHLYIIIAFQKTLSYLAFEFKMNSVTFLIYTFGVSIICSAIIWIIKSVLNNKSRYVIGS